MIEAEGKHVFPAFFDPHVHLRTPGDEDEEDIETGTRAAAAGGYCGMLAMANTEPARRHGGRRPGAARAGGRARPPCPTGFLACVTRGMEGEELTEMAELRDAGAVGFSDDGLPIANARVMRRALQYQHLVRRQHRAPRGGPRPLAARRRPRAAPRRRDARGRRLRRARARRASRRSPSRR